MVHDEEVKQLALDCNLQIERNGATVRLVHDRRNETVGTMVDGQAIPVNPHYSTELVYQTIVRKLSTRYSIHVRIAASIERALEAQGLPIPDVEEVANETV